jgi:hypothetical protein
MNNNLLLKALVLFIETMDLSDMLPDHPKFEELFEKECELFDILGKLKDEEKNKYREIVIKMHKILTD